MTQGVPVPLLLFYKSKPCLALSLSLSVGLLYIFCWDRNPTKSLTRLLTESISSSFCLFSDSAADRLYSSFIFFSYFSWETTTTGNWARRRYGRRWRRRLPGFLVQQIGLPPSHLSPLPLFNVTRFFFPFSLSPLFLLSPFLFHVVCWRPSGGFFIWYSFSYFCVWHTHTSS